LSVHDFKRAAEKLRAWTSKPKQDESEDTAEAKLPENLTVHSPVHWPGFKNRFERNLNLALFMRSLKKVLHPDDPPTAVITTAAIPSDLAKARPDLNWVYYCVDDLSQWPGLDGESLLRLERDMLPHIKSFVSVSNNLQTRLGALGHDSTLITHGIDLEHWNIERRALGAAKPVALYWGHADRRLDSQVCLALADRLRLRMVGPQTDVDPLLREHPDIDWTGSVDYAQLPDEAARADVLVMPYADLAVTRAMQPLKLKEYLATGLPVIATPLPATEPWADTLDLSADPAEFAKLTFVRARTELDAAQANARKRLQQEGWSSKAHAFEDVFSKHAPECSEDKR